MRALFALSLILALSSCAKNKEESATSLVRVLHTASLTESLSVARNAQLHCADPADCPAAVGLLVSVGTDPNVVSTCTSFLVGEDLLLTNSHCLPSAVKMLPDLCAERVSVVFTDGRSFRCAALLRASERPNAISPDLAVLRLEKKTGLRPLGLDRAGVEINRQYLAYKIDPGSGASGELVAQRCLSVPGSYRFPLYKNKRDPLFLTGDCASRAGNSGAPLLDKSGRAVGIFQAELGLTQEQRDAWAPHLRAGEEFSPLAIGTSLRCLKAECAPTDEESLLLPSIADFASPSLPAPSALLRWEQRPTRRRSLERQEGMTPVCFKDPQEWIERYRRPGTDEYEQDASIEVALPTLLQRIVFNRYMQVSAEAKVSTTNARGRFSPASLAEKGSSPLDLGDTLVDLPVCTN